MSRSALVISYAEMKDDPRVRNQLSWLTGAGYAVDTLGRGEPPAAVNGRHIRISRWILPIRLLAYAFLPNQIRFNFLMKFWLWVGTRKASISPRGYDLIVLNTIDYLPWLSDLRKRALKPTGAILVDLHEYSANQGIGIVWATLFKRYQFWLTKFINSPLIDVRTTVSPQIAKLYAENFSVPLPTVIFNVPPSEQLKPSPVSSPIKLIHHGKADLARGLSLMLEAMTIVDARFHLYLMLVGEQMQINELRRKVDELSLGKRVTFVEPVALQQVASRLNQFDVEIIFFPPVTENLRLVLPNKYFEAVQARLGILSGPSVEIQEVSARYSNGVFTESWDSVELARTINNLTAETIQRLKKASNRAAVVLNAEAVGAEFMELVSN